jgi:hypothetical protein
MGPVFVVQAMLETIVKNLFAKNLAKMEVVVSDQIAVLVSMATPVGTARSITGTPVPLNFPKILIST